MEKKQLTSNELAAEKYYKSHFNGIGQETQVYKRSFTLGFVAGIAYHENGPRGDLKFAAWLFDNYVIKGGNYYEVRKIPGLALFHSLEELHNFYLKTVNNQGEGPERSVAENPLSESENPAT